MIVFFYFLQKGNNYKNDIIKIYYLGLVLDLLSIIQEYSNHLEEIFENSFDYIYLHDKEGNILDVNNIVVKNLGYSKNEILKMKVTDFLLEEHTSSVTEEIKITMETGVVNKPKY